jgi:carbon storage regulator CsrA
MLLLERNEGESIIIENDDFTIKVLLAKDKKGRYKLCIDAPDEFDIFRKELIDE